VVSLQENGGGAMTTYTKKKLEKILHDHKTWLDDNKGNRANLSRADLSYADLSDTNLRGAKTDKKYISISCVGSRKEQTNYCFDDMIWRGCFKGTLAEFKEQVKKKHKDNKLYLSEYLGFINYVKALKEVE